MLHNISVAPFNRQRVKEELNNNDNNIIILLYNYYLYFAKRQQAHIHRMVACNGVYICVYNVLAKRAIDEMKCTYVQVFKPIRVRWSGTRDRDTQFASSISHMYGWAGWLAGFRSYYYTYICILFCTTQSFKHKQTGLATLFIIGFFGPCSERLELLRLLRPLRRRRHSAIDAVIFAIAHWQQLRCELRTANAMFFWALGLKCRKHQQNKSANFRTSARMCMSYRYQIKYIYNTKIYDVFKFLYIIQYTHV